MESKFLGRYLLTLETVEQYSELIAFIEAIIDILMFSKLFPKQN